MVVSDNISMTMRPLFYMYFDQTIEILRFTPFGKVKSQQFIGDAYIL